MFKILFFTFSNIDIGFVNRKFISKTYSTTKVLYITQKIEIIDRKKFITMVLNKKDKIFVIYLATFGIDLNIYLFYQA